MDWKPMIKPRLPGSGLVGKMGKNLPRGRGARDVKLPAFRFLARGGYK